MRMTISIGAGVALAAVSMLAGPRAEGDQGKSGDNTDWGCGGHPATAAELSTGTSNGHKGALFSTQGTWQNWWYLNRPVLLAELSYRVAGPQPDAKATEPWRDRPRAALRKLLDSSVVPLASDAALALGRSGDARDTKALAAIAGDTRRQHSLRRRAVLALGLLDVEAGESAAAARDTLFGVAQEAVGNYDDRLELWSFAAWGLGLRRDATALPRLSEFVRHYRPRKDSDDHGVHRDVMAAAVGALGLFKDPLLLPDLADVMADADGAGSMVRRKAVVASFAAYGCARIGDPAALPALCRATLDDRVDVRRGALLAIGAVAGPKDDAAVRALCDVLASDRDDVCRGFAAVSLGRTGADAAPAALRAAYASGSSNVRSFASLGLGLRVRRAPDAQVTAFLLSELMAQHDAYEMGALCIANGLANHLDARRRLAELALRGGETTLRSHAAFALGLLGIEGCPPEVLLELVRSGDGVIRHEAGLALGLARRRDGADALADLVAKGDGLPVRGSAAVALGRIGGPEVAPVLLRVLESDDEMIAMRICAAHGLGLLLDRNEGRRLGLLGADVNWVNEENRVNLLTEFLDQVLIQLD